MQGNVSTYRLGGWHSMVIHSGYALRLNSPREADELCHRHVANEQGDTPNEPDDRELIVEGAEA